MNLTDLASKGWIRAHRTSQEEIRDKFALIDRNIKNAQVPGIDPDLIMNVTHNAHLQCAIAALYGSGYEPSKEHQHYRALQSLGATLKLCPNEVAVLDTFRRMRNNADYDRAGEVSERDAADSLAWAIELRGKLFAYLQANVPELVVGI